MAYDEAMVRETFNRLDTDKSGFVTLEELKQSMFGMRGGLTESEVNEYMAEIDTSKDAKISFDEFAATIKKMYENFEE